MRQPVSAPESSSEGGRTAVALMIPAVPEWVGVARLAAAGIGNRIGLSIEDIEDLKLAVAESCNCCIQNGGTGDVAISFGIEDDRLSVGVARAGSGQKQPQAAPAAADDESDLDGLGVFLIRALMDDVAYAADRASGTRLTLTKLIRK